MRVLLWLVRGLLFFMLLGLAIKNSGDVELRFFLDARWHAPLSLVILATFVTGILAGLISVLPIWVRQRRMLTKLRTGNHPDDKGTALSKLVEAGDLPER